MRLIVQVARLLPAFRRLQDRLDQLASDNRKLERLVAQQHEALAKLRQQRRSDPDIHRLLEQQGKDRDPSTDCPNGLTTGTHIIYQMGSGRVTRHGCR